jgi:hypothetical protein
VSPRATPTTSPKNPRPPAAIPPQRSLATVLELFDWRTNGKPGTWKACCPAHPDTNPSCGLKLADAGPGRQRLLVFRFAGCTVAVTDALVGTLLKGSAPTRIR